MLFWVRGGDKTGEQSNRAHEGIRRGRESCWKIQWLRGCFHHVCKAGTEQPSQGMGAGMGVGHRGQVSLPWVFRLAALLTDIYCSVHHSQQASPSVRLGKACWRTKHPTQDCQTPCAVIKVLQSLRMKSLVVSTGVPRRASQEGDLTLMEVKMQKLKLADATTQKVATRWWLAAGS